MESSVVSMFAGMLLVGSVVYRVRTFNYERFAFIWKIAAFVYVSIAVGLILSNYADVKAFQEAFVFGNVGWMYSNNPVPQTPALLMLYGAIGFAFMGAIAASDTKRERWFGEGRLAAVTEFIAKLFVGGFLGLGAFTILCLASYILVCFEFGRIVLFVLMLLVIATANSFLGIVTIALNLSLVAIAYFTGQSVNPVNLLNIVTIVHVDHYVIGLVMLGLTTVIGALELALEHWLGAIQHQAS